LSGENTKQGNGVKSFSIWIALSVLVVAFDHLTKWMIVKWVPMYDKIPINSFINITHQRNTGAAFSFLNDAGGWQRYFFTAVASTISAGLVVWLFLVSRGQRLLAFSLALILGGALGNLWDRATLGYVVDFISVHYQGRYFPAFNIADSAISVGAALMLWDSFITRDGSGES